MTKRNTVLILALVLTLLLAGCSSALTRYPAGSVIFYDSPTREFRTPEAALSQELTARQLRSVTGIVRSVREWNDDAAVSRAPFTFDGELHIYNTTYYFSFDSGILYYNHFYGALSPEQSARIRELFL